MKKAFVIMLSLIIVCGCCIQTCFAIEPSEQYSKVEDMIYYPWWESAYGEIGDPTNKDIENFLYALSFERTRNVSKNFEYYYITDFIICPNNADDPYENEGLYALNSDNITLCRYYSSASYTIELTSGFIEEFEKLSATERLKTIAKLYTYLVKACGCKVDFETRLGWIDFEAYTMLSYDVDFDGRLNTKDLILMKRYISGNIDDSFDMLNLIAIDQNGDGRVNSKDLAQIKRALATG